MRVFRIIGDSTRLKNITCRRTARRNARRFLEAYFADLQVMLSSNRLRVPQPRTDDVRRELFLQLGLTTGSQVVPQRRPGRQASTLDDLLELRS